jgi:hypothetical protein
MLILTFGVSYLLERSSSLSENQLWALPHTRQVKVNHIPPPDLPLDGGGVGGGEITPPCPPLTPPVKGGERGGCLA